MIKFIDINVIFNKGTSLEKKVLNNLGNLGKNENLTIENGDFISIIGGNGAGKSTLLEILTGEIDIYTGKIELDGEDLTKKSIKERASLISKVSQDPMIGTFANLTIEENLIIAYNRNKKGGIRSFLSKSYRIARINKQGFFSRLFRSPKDSNKTNKIKKFVSFASKELKNVGIDLDKQLGEKVGDLSGGQRQALSLIMATLQDSKILLLDEHTAALDPINAKKIMDLTVRIIKEKKLTAIMVTHCLDHIRFCGNNRIWVMNHGRITYGIQVITDMNRFIIEFIYDADGEKYIHIGETYMLKYIKLVNEKIKHGHIGGTTNYGLGSDKYETNSDKNYLKQITHDTTMENIGFPGMGLPEVYRLYDIKKAEEMDLDLERMRASIRSRSGLEVKEPTGEKGKYELYSTEHKERIDFTEGEKKDNAEELELYNKKYKEKEELDLATKRFLAAYTDEFGAEVLSETSIEISEKGRLQRLEISSSPKTLQDMLMGNISPYEHNGVYILEYSNYYNGQNMDPNLIIYYHQKDMILGKHH